LRQRRRCHPNGRGSSSMFIHAAIDRPPRAQFALAAL
jgi:hypothetical protein